jgi:hypothetical protein
VSILAALAVLGVAVPGQSASAAPPPIQAGRLSIALDDTGVVTQLLDTRTGRDFASADHRRPLIQIVANEQGQNPTAVTYDAGTQEYTFEFPAGTSVSVKAVGGGSYATFEITQLVEGSGVDVRTLYWGPVTTSISKTVGEIVGVVSNSDFAIGIHGLNDKTLGGWVHEDKALSYYDPSFEYLMPFDWNAAYETPWGSVLQAYTYDYTVPRTRYAGQFGTSLWMPDQPVPVIPAGPPGQPSDGEIVGSKIALFGAAPEHVLGTLETLELEQGLPHPTIDGEWQKTSQKTTQSHFWVRDLNTSNVERAAQYAKDAGLNVIYAIRHARGPWVTNGHFQFDAGFGGSDAAAKELVDKAAALGVQVGVHTLANFIDPGDPYITPTPSANLVRAGEAKLTRDLDGTSTDVYVDSKVPFENSLGKYIQIGDEIITFATLTEMSPAEWRLSGGTRGAFGTVTSAHTTDATVHRIMGNQYGGLVGGLPIMREIATRLATIVNTTGIQALSYDGLETGAQTGYGTYPAAQLVNGVYRQLADKDGFVSEASNVYPSIWDALGRISWGEQGWSVYRDRVAVFLERNYVPRGLGQLPIYATAPQREAMLARMASANAGAEFYADVSDLDTRADRAAILDEIKQWETARNLGAFTPNQRRLLRDPARYWHLSPDPASGPNHWTLQETSSDGNTNIGAPLSVYPGNTDPQSSISNLALTATARASSTFSGTYRPNQVNDGVKEIADTGEWASKGEQNPWVQLDWLTPQKIDSVTLADRGNLTDHAPGGTLSFSDGTTVPVSGLANDGTSMTITFPTREVTWVRFQVSGGAGYNVGLAEFEAHRTSPNLAWTATPSASSTFDSRYPTTALNDGIAERDGFGEWVSSGELNPWVRLDWSTPRLLGEVRIFDRVNSTDSANGGTLTFSDGSSVPVSGIRNDGGGHSVTFSPREVTWVKFEVDGGAGTNVGLSEFQAFGPGNIATAASSATASSVFDSRYTAEKAIDGITQQGGTGEWASLQELTPWLKLDWSTPQTISAVKIFDRVNLTDWARAGTLTFSDGSTVQVGGIPNDGAPLLVTFPPRQVTWIKFQVTDGTGSSNVGLSELEVYPG